MMQFSGILEDGLGHAVPISGTFDRYPAGGATPDGSFRASITDVGAMDEMYKRRLPVAMRLSDGLPGRVLILDYHVHTSGQITGTFAGRWHAEREQTA